MAYGIMKSELLFANKFKSRDAFIHALNEYIDYYNNRRIKLRLKGLSPVDYRKKYFTDDGIKGADIVIQDEQVLSK